MDRSSLRSLVLVVALTPCVHAQNQSLTLEVGQQHQVLAGFGASTVYFVDWWYDHPQRDALDELAFDDLGLDILRLVNIYEIPRNGKTWEQRMDEQAELVQRARAHGVTRFMISSWTPPAALKKNGQLLGGTLGKDTQDQYLYAEFGTWWAEALEEYAARGVTFDWLSMQNEPDYGAATHEACRFEPYESTNHAGFWPAYDAMRSALQASSAPLPRLLGPETTYSDKVQNYTSALADDSIVDDWSHHLYGIPFHQPDAGVADMQAFHASHGDRPVHMTEFSNLANNVDTFVAALDLARHIHNALVHENVASFSFWHLTWPEPFGDSDGLIELDDPQLASAGWSLREEFYGLQSFARFLGPGWTRVELAGAQAPLHASAFLAPDGREVICVFVNPSTEHIFVDLDVLGFDGAVAEGWRTNNTSVLEPLGWLSTAETVTLRKRSITTLRVTSESGLGCTVVETCAGAANSAGAGAQLHVAGSTSATVDDFALTASGLPPGEFGTLIYGPEALSVPIGDGTLCVNVPFDRVGIEQANSLGNATSVFQIGGPFSPGFEVLSGSSYHFQFWYRDQPAGNAGSNLSDALRITFCP